MLTTANCHQREVIIYHISSCGVRTFWSRDPDVWSLRSESVLQDARELRRLHRNRDEKSWNEVSRNKFEKLSARTMSSVFVEVMLQPFRGPALVFVEDGNLKGSVYYFQIVDCRVR